MAVAAIRRATAEAVEPVGRLALLPAEVEIMLEAGEVGAAREAYGELVGRRHGVESELLDAIVQQAEGAVELAEGEPRVRARPAAPFAADVPGARRARTRSLACGC